MKNRYKIAALLLLLAGHCRSAVWSAGAAAGSSGYGAGSWHRLKLWEAAGDAKTGGSVYKKTQSFARIELGGDELVGYYYQEAGSEGIRPDLALSQAIKETGCFAYGGDVSPQQNNYCGLGTTGAGVKGCTFSRPQQGVRAHIQHLLAYATKRPPQQELIDPRYQLLREKHPEIFGCCHDVGGVKWEMGGSRRTLRAGYPAYR